MITITINGVEIKCGIITDDERPKRTDKGKSIVDFPSSYTVIDLETTGLDPYYDEIIEMSALKIVDGNIVDSFSELVRPQNEIDDFIIELTGITNEMLSKASSIEDVLPKFLAFVGSSIIVGHNVNFDINFIYDYSLKYLDRPFSNDFVDTLRIARKVLPNLNHHRLDDLVSYYSLKPRKEHRALSDCDLTFSIYLKLKDDSLSKYGSLSEFKNAFKPKSYPKLKATDITATNTDFDQTHPLYNKTVVFTGQLETLPRKEAMQLVANLGGKCADSVVKTTDYLVFAVYYCA